MKHFDILNKFQSGDFLSKHWSIREIGDVSNKKERTNHDGSSFYSKGKKQNKMQNLRYQRIKLASLNSAFVSYWIVCLKQFSLILELGTFRNIYLCMHFNNVGNKWKLKRLVNQIKRSCFIN